jgi:type I restriction enzyme, S subunit
MTGAEIAASQRLRVRAKQFILSRIDARNGALGLVPESLEGGVVSSDFPVFTPNSSRILPEFLGWLSKTNSFVDLCKAASEGTTNRVRLKEDKFLAFRIPLPSLDEQRRIVARIEALAAKIEEARGLRHQAFTELEAVGPAAAATAFVNPKWPACSIEKLVGRANLKNGRSVKATSIDSEVHCLRLSALRNGHIDCNDSKPVPLTLEEAKPHLVRAGDVFIVRGNGSKELVGRAGMITESRDALIFPDLFIRVPLDGTRLLPSYFVAVWNSRPVRNVIEDAAKTTSGIWKINQGHIASVLIPVPPVAEQPRAVAYLDGLQTKVDALKRLQAETAAELDALLPSILDRAFKGEL